MKLNIYITLETICSIKLCWEILIEVALFYLESRNAIEEIFFFKKLSTWYYFNVMSENTDLCSVTYVEILRCHFFYGKTRLTKIGLNHERY